MLAQEKAPEPQIEAIEEPAKAGKTAALAEEEVDWFWGDAEEEK